MRDYGAEIGPGYRYAHPGYGSCEALLPHNLDQIDHRLPDPAEDPRPLVDDLEQVATLLAEMNAYLDSLTTARGNELLLALPKGEVMPGDEIEVSVAEGGEALSFRVPSSSKT